MLPFVINNNPSRLVQVAMSGPVGTGGQNVRNDVVLVQSLLNAIASSDRGPQTKLDIDGIAGPLTVAAIRRYQQACTHIVDGRVDPHGPTIKSLVTTLNDRGALPQGLPNIGQPSQSVARALTGYSSIPLTMSRADKFPLLSQNQKAKSPSGIKALMPPMGPSPGPLPPMYTGPTGWDFVTSSGTSVSVLIVGVSVINIVMKHDSEPGLTYQFSFAGSGVGLSAMPVGLDFSASSMPSFGTKMLKVNPLLGKAPPINAGDLDLLPTCILDVGFNAGPGWSGMIIFWGSVGPLLPFTRYVNAITGFQVGIPGPSITLYVGAIAGWM